MQVPVINMAGEQVKTIDLPAEIFEVEVNINLMHQAYIRQLANARLGTAKAQTRADVNRTTAKWYRQKGTGRARHGSRKAPIFVGGGKAHGPQPRDYTQKMPRKMRRAALRSALSALVRDNQLVVLDEFKLNDARTREAARALWSLVQDQSTLVLLPGRDEAVERSLRNIPNVTTLHASYLNIRDLFTHDRVIMPLGALDVIRSFLGKAQEG